MALQGEFDLTLRFAVSNLTRKWSFTKPIPYPAVRRGVLIFTECCSCRKVNIRSFCSYDSYDSGGESLSCEPIFGESGFYERIKVTQRHHIGDLRVVQADRRGGQRETPGVVVFLSQIRVILFARRDSIQLFST